MITAVLLMAMLVSLGVLVIYPNRTHSNTFIVVFVLWIASAAVLGF